MEIGTVHQVDIDEQMRAAYLDYAMSVIVARALPDARDGLKPVHRRILYAMHDMGVRSSTAYRKSARIVGEVLGKYHPHGDAAVYETMARMAQDFSMRYPLIDGKATLGRSMVTPRQPCATRRRAWAVWQRSYWSISTRIQSISAITSMAHCKSQGSYRLDYPIFCSTDLPESRWVWRPTCLLTT